MFTASLFARLFARPLVFFAPDDGGGAGGSGGEGDKGGKDSTDTGGSGSGDTDKGSGTGASGDGDKGGGAATLTMSQADFDAAIEKRLAKAKKSWDDEAKTAADRAKMDEADRAKAELADAQKAADEKVKGSHARLVKAEAKVAALAAGVKGDRVARFLRNVDLDDIDVDDDGNIDEAAAAKAVKAALDDVPEFKGGSSSNGNGSSGASGSDHNGSGNKKVWTREEVAKLSVEEFEKHEAEIMAQMKGAGIK